MKPSHRFSMWAVCVCGLLTFSTESNAADQNTVSAEILAGYSEYLHQLSGLVGESQGKRPHARPVGLGNAKLHAAKLDTGSGLGVTTVGLTPIAEWRALFPIRAVVQAQAR